MRIKRITCPHCETWINVEPAARRQVGVVPATCPTCNGRFLLRVRPKSIEVVDPTEQPEVMATETEGHDGQ